MIWDKTQDYKEKSMKGKLKTITEQCVNSKPFKKLSDQQLKQFLDQHQIIHCAYYMSDIHSYSKMLRIYFLLFQVSIKCSSNQSLYNFLVQHNFNDRIVENIPQNVSIGQKIILGKVCHFLDSFKLKRCSKYQINSLVNQYHEFRLLQNWKQQSFVFETCSIIKQFLYHNLNFLLNQLQYTNWNELNEQAFQKFYDHYSDLCTICKRIAYIKCRILELPSFQISSSIRALIEQRHRTIKDTTFKQNKMHQIQTPPLTEFQKTNEKPILNVKKKLKAMKSIINQMQMQMI